MRHLFIATSVAAVLAVLLAGCATPPPATPLQVKLLAINDFHGNLKPPLGGIRIKDPADPAKTLSVPAGGAEYLASAVDELRAKNPNHVFVAAGDLIGASPLLSALFRDEPTIEALSTMGLEITAVGNHEFDKGAAELLRMQRGGCGTVEGSCKGPRPFQGARFQYLAASTVVQATGQTLLPAYAIKRFEGVPVAFIGLTLKETPSMVVPAGVAGLSFRDEAETVNGLLPELQKQGVAAFVVLIHEGGVPVGDYNECPGISGAIVDIVKKLDKAVAVVVSGHTHRAYNCRIDGRLVTSGDKYGTIVTQIDLTLDRSSGTITRAAAENVIVRTDRYPKHSVQTGLIAAYEKLAVPLARRAVGMLGASLSRDANAAGESPLGQVIADAQLAATRAAGAQIALMNPGGIRAALARADDGQVHYEDLFAVQPFYNNLVTLTLSGAQLLQLLEQQWQNQASARLLQLSQGFSYTWDASRPIGQRVLPDSLKLDGQPIGAGSTVRVTVNAFMASGGDGFVMLKQGRDVSTGMMDVDALELYVKENPGLKPGTQSRVTRLN
jgi:5'-nucleotidase